MRSRYHGQVQYLGFVAALLLVPLAGCTTPRAGDYKQAEADPWEKTNRKIYAINKKIDKYALKPVAIGYKTIVPKPARTGIGNIYNTYGQPLNFVNAVLQGKIKQAFRSVDRFLINATIGVGGLSDAATDLGRPEEPEDFGQTFAVWGIKTGPYVVLPVFGPSTVRDGVGTAIDIFQDPADVIRGRLLRPGFLFRTGQFAVRLASVRSRIIDQGGDKLLADSLDEYTLVKSAYMQNRVNAIWDGNPPVAPDEPDDSAPAAGAPARHAPGNTRRHRR